MARNGTEDANYAKGDFVKKRLYLQTIISIYLLRMLFLLKDAGFLQSLFFVSPQIFVRLALCALIAILFLQSGLDKVFQWQGNLGWLRGHFAKTFLKDTVPFMLWVVTILEVAAGVCCAVGFVEILVWRSTMFALLGGELATAVLLMLFFGQRIAQDYAGAASLVPYFLVTLLSVILFDINAN